jgi:hypothetical protein
VQTPYDECGPIEKKNRNKIKAWDPSDPPRARPRALCRKVRGVRRPLPTEELEEGDSGKRCRCSGW